MGIKVEFNPDLALRKHGTPRKLENECLPQTLIVGAKYQFLKTGQRNYWLEGDIPLCETQGDQKLSRPRASIRILEATHVMMLDQLYTKGIYQVNEVYDAADKTIHFEGMQKIKS